MEERVKKVRYILKVEKLDALFISSNINIRYLTCFEGFGNHEREGFALLTNSKLYVFADPRLSEGAKINAKNSTVVEFGAGKKLLPLIQEIIDSENLNVVGFEENLTFAEYTRFKKLKNTKLKLTEEIIEDVRVVKDSDELENLKQACKLTDETFSYVLKHIIVGTSELEVAWEIEKYIREHGGYLAFPTIAAFEKNSAVPHHSTGNQKLEKNNIVLLDFGAQVNGYCADMTRTIYFGKAPDEFRKIYKAVRVGQEKSVKLKTTDNLTCEEIDKTARDYITFQKYPSVPHSVGHGVGLQVHELPHVSPGFTDEILPNTPFTIEPGIYINGVGGVRIEDTVYFDGNTIEQLTKSDKTLIEI